MKIGVDKKVKRSGQAHQPRTPLPSSRPERERGYGFDDHGPAIPNQNSSR